MKGITYTQVAQYIVLISAYIIPAIFISIQLTGNPIPQLGLGSNLTGHDISLLATLDKVVTDLGFGKYTTSLPGSTLNMFVYTMSLMIGTAGLPHVIMRFFTVPTVKAARSSAGWALVFIALLYTTCLLYTSYQMQDRLLLDMVDYERGVITLNGVEYPLLDTLFPTIDPKNPDVLTAEEQMVIEKLKLSFANSKKLQQHVRFLFSTGSLYLIHDGNLLYHGCIAMEDDGEFKSFNVDGKSFAGRCV